MDAVRMPMKWSAAVALLASLVSVAPVAAQAPPTWLSGEWKEVARGKLPAKGKSKDKAAAETPATLQVAIGNGILRIVEDGPDGQDLRCRLDGTEMVYKQTRKDATFDYMLQCEAGPQSVEVTGLFTVDGVEGFPPREFELRKKYELATDGSLRRQDQAWGIIPGLGRVPVADSTISFSRKR